MPVTGVLLSTSSLLNCLTGFVADGDTGFVVNKDDVAARVFSGFPVVDGILLDEDEECDDVLVSFSSSSISTTSVTTMVSSL